MTYLVSGFRLTEIERNIIAPIDLYDSYAYWHNVFQLLHPVDEKPFSLAPRDWKKKKNITK